MISLVTRYAHWLHTGWPAGRTEKLPVLAEDGSTKVPGLWVAGDLTGIPLLKFSADGGTRVVRRVVATTDFAAARRHDPEAFDLVILGAGIAGMAAALEAQQHGLRFVVVEAQASFATIRNFPKGKPIFTYPSGMTPAGALQFAGDVKETLLEELDAQTREKGIEILRGRAEFVRRRAGVLEVVMQDGAPLRAHRVLVAIGRSGNYRTLDVPGTELPKVFHRLHDPADFAGQDVLVVGGGDSAAETAIALAEAGARVTLSYRQHELVRPKPESTERLRRLAREDALDLRLGSEVRAIHEDDVVLTEGSDEHRQPNDVVFAMIGREAPLDFFRRSGVSIRGETRWFGWIAFALFLLACVWVFNWKSDGWLAQRFAIDAEFWSLSDDPSSVAGTLTLALQRPSFWYTLGYSLLIVIFGWRRIRRRRTPYVTVQTWVLIAFQVLPLFLLPELLLPYLGHNGVFESGTLRDVADSLFPGEGGHREFWRAYGLILAWPLNVYNVFTHDPIWGWIAIAFVQTFVLIPLLIWRWGKGAYCGWICSCGALAETVGDTERAKMPHGPGWNRLNMLGQGILLVAFALLLVRIAGWIWPGSVFARLFDDLLYGTPATGHAVSYKWIVDVTLAGVLGVGLYFMYSGRTWCRFACPLAALMHVYARFSRFRILADKKRCISCNECTSICHQGIDVMSFANKGQPMADPQCVRCSACVQVCPTGVLEFGRIDPRTGEETARDTIAASPVLLRERR